MRVVGIEAGGTKVVCATGTGPDDCSPLHRIATTTPDETIAAIVDHVADQARQGPVDAIGLATFGPIDLDPSSPTHGHLTTTPKAAWQGVDLVGRLATATGLPVGFDTDVNGAAIGEHRWGAGVGADNLVYLTVGTGVGGGVVVDGRPVHGLLHPEVGHLVVRHHPDDDFAGSCRFHGDCLEGLAAGPSLVARFGRRGEELTGDDLARAVSFSTFAMAQAVVAVTYVVSPRRVVVGGGVSKLAGFLPALRTTTSDLLAGALASPVLTGDLADYVVAPGLGDRSGVLGAIALGVRTAEREGHDDAG